MITCRCSFVFFLFFHDVDLKGEFIDTVLFPHKDNIFAPTSVFFFLNFSLM